MAAAYRHGGSAPRGRTGAQRGGEKKCCEYRGGTAHGALFAEERGKKKKAVVRFA